VIISKFDQEIARTMAAVKEFAESHAADRAGDQTHRGRSVEHASS
jgi:hypothetical protein